MLVSALCQLPSTLQQTVINNMTTNLHVFHFMCLQLQQIEEEVRFRLNSRHERRYAKLVTAVIWLLWISVTVKLAEIALELVHGGDGSHTPMVLGGRGSLEGVIPDDGVAESANIPDVAGVITSDEGVTESHSREQPDDHVSAESADEDEHSRATVEHSIVDDHSDGTPVEPRSDRHQGHKHNGRGAAVADESSRQHMASQAGVYAQEFKGWLSGLFRRS